MYVYTGQFDIDIIPKLEYEIDIDKLLLLKYVEGSSFPIHTHTKITDNHLGDLIIYSPNQDFSGGDLIIHHHDHKEIVTTSNLKEWKCVFLPLSIPHEVTPITSGVRYSFKYELYS